LFIFSQNEPEKTRAEEKAGPSTSEGEKRLSASELKIGRETVEVPLQRRDWSGHCLVDIDLILEAISNAAVCKSCGGKIEIKETCQRGHTSIFSVKCEICEKTASFKNCAKVENAEKTYELNRRMVYAARATAIGHEGLKKFCAIMDLPPPLVVSNFQKAMEVRSLLHLANNVLSVLNMSYNIFGICFR